MLKTRLRASESELEKTFSAVEEHLVLALPDQNERDLFLLAFVEALNNAAEHGNKWEPSAAIRVDGHFRPGLALLLIEDDGPGFVPRFPDLPEVEGKRGRGLGFIKKFTDLVLFNREGNQITLWKGCKSMAQELKYSKATVARLPENVVVVTDFAPSNGIFDAMSELLDVVNRTGWTRLFIDLGSVKLLTSTVWGSLFAEAGREGAELLVLFNCPSSVVASAQAMGVHQKRDSYARILVAPDFREPFLLLCESLAKSD